MFILEGKGYFKAVSLLRNAYQEDIYCSGTLSNILFCKSICVMFFLLIHIVDSLQQQFMKPDLFRRSILSTLWCSQALPKYLSLSLSLSKEIMILLCLDGFLLKNYRVFFKSLQETKEALTQYEMFRFSPRSSLLN